MALRVVESVDNSCHTFHLRAVYHDNVQNGIHTLGILAGSRVGNDLYALHHRGWHRLEYLLGIFRQRGI